jgi:hypothetical protein
MKLSASALALSLLLAAGCDNSTEPRTSPQRGADAASGASTAPANPSREQVTPAPTGGAPAEKTRPDPGDANDHSTPKHDARQKSEGGAPSESK